jgi:hypothetical protein
MPTKPLPHIITANDLITGEVVYYTKSGTWARHHRKASVFLDIDFCAKQLAQIVRSDAAIVGPYIVAVKTVKDQAAAPAHFREAFRATGPSNRFIGKQAHV